MLKIELPVRTVLLCDGGKLDWAGEEYTQHDSLFGVFAELGTIREGTGDQAPSLTIKLTPDPAPAADALIDPGYQFARVRIWTADVDQRSGTIIGDPVQDLDMLIDVPRLRFPKEGRSLEIDCVSGWQRLFDINEGNVLNGPMHRRIYSSEAGMDNTTGVSTTVAWGDKGPRGIQ
jgi:hypothetical protein